MTTSMSPSTSPRLPSPPPFPEVQIGPKSPSSNTATSAGPSTNADVPKTSNGSANRIRPGTRAAVMAAGPEFIPLTEIDSPFALQEYLKALWHHHARGPSNTIQAITREAAQTIASPPDGTDRSLWLLELCRLLVTKTNELFIAFFIDNPPCSAQTCPEMRASEWQYLCAVHEPPKSCCAIDYCSHALDWAANTLSDQNLFPSRISLGGEAPGSKQAAEKQLTNIFRRVYRLYAHAWFQHRQIFWNVEGKTGHYALFKTICDVYALIPAENYTIPPEAEGIVASETETQPAAPTILQRPSEDQKAEGDEATTTISTGATTRRHKHTPSTGSAVTTIQEGEEEEHEGESFPMIRETPSMQNLGQGLRDVRVDEPAPDQPAPAPAPPRPAREDEKAPGEAPPKPAEPPRRDEEHEEDFTISEPLIVDEKGAEEKASTESLDDKGPGTGEPSENKGGDDEK